MENQNADAIKFEPTAFPISAEAAKGKAVASYDSRKKVVVEALKKASNCRKVTMVRELKTGGFSGNCMYSNSSGGSNEGFWFVPSPFTTEVK